MHCKLIRFPDFMDVALSRFEAGWSLEQIECDWSVTQCVSVMRQSIGTRIPKMGAPRSSNSTSLGTAGTGGCGACVSTMAVISLMNWRFTHRPVVIANRDQFGHRECDLVVFRKEFGKANVTSLVERVSRFAVVLKNPDRQSKPVMEALIESLSPLPANARRSITFDRGTEFRAWQHLKDGLGVDPWFCDLRSPWQKGTVESTNNRLRRYLPRKADPTAFTNRYSRSICDPLNATPRKCLGYQTSAEVFRAKLMEREL